MCVLFSSTLFFRTKQLFQGKSAWHSYTYLILQYAKKGVINYIFKPCRTNVRWLHSFDATEHKNHCKRVWSSASSSSSSTIYNTSIWLVSRSPQSIGVVQWSLAGKSMRHHYLISQFANLFPIPAINIKLLHIGTRFKKSRAISSHFGLQPDCSH